MGLSEYKRKRDFSRTPEPAGAPAATAGWSFVVQKHSARSLHYDLRLELDGVLKSWAVPKGPCLDPSQRRLAVRVEDHPVEYGGFEGVIPAGEYGGGTVMLWDRGTWEPLGDPRADVEQGKLKFKLHGGKLGGGWMLVRKGASTVARSTGANPDEKVWFLIKERDDAARPLAAGDVLVEAPRSVTSGRDLDEIAAARDRVWSCDGPANGSKPGVAAQPKAVGKRSGADSPKHKNAFNAEPFVGVRLTSPDKVLYPDLGITKLELAQYYVQISEWILPHLANRPLVLVRCPGGLAGKCFYQKHPGAGCPEALRRIDVQGENAIEQFVVVDNAAGLVSLAQIGALEVHVWGSQANNTERPDRLVFDLDPDPAVTWGRLVESALQIRQFLGDLGLESFVKTSGGKGLHLVVPIQRRHTWDEVRRFCKGVTNAIVAADPRRYTANAVKAARGGKIYIDIMRNSRGSTTVAAYSTRAAAGANVSTPLSWDELSPALHPGHFNLRSLPQRLAALKHDPWEGIDSLRQSLSARVTAKLGKYY